MRVKVSPPSEYIVNVTPYKLYSLYLTKREFIFEPCVP